MRYRIRTLLLLFAVFWIGALVWWGGGKLVLWSVFRDGAILSEEDWPWLLTALMQERPGCADVVGVYALGGITGKEYLWKVHVPTDSLEDVLESLALQEDLGANFATDLLKLDGPEWWPALSDRDNTLRYFATHYFSTDNVGPDGEHLYAAYDESKQVLHVWHKSYF